MTDHDLIDEELYQAACAAVGDEADRPKEQRRGLVRVILGAAMHILRPRIEQLETERDTAYHDRAEILAWVATTVPAVTTPAADIDEPGWLLLYLTTKAGQMSWHIAPRDAPLFWHVEHVKTGVEWDGHTTDEKHQRIQQLIRQTAVRPGSAHTEEHTYEPGRCRLAPRA